MEIWLRGYCLARDLPESERVPEGFWLEVAKPQQAGRFILRKFDPAAIEALINRITEPAVYIEFPGTAAQASPLLPHGWSLRDDAYLMERSFPLAAMPNATEVDGYIFTERSRAKGLEVDVRTTGGAVMAHGCYAEFDGVAVFDQIATEPAHQHHGIGRAILTRLSAHATSRAIPKGLLVATEAGRGLYTAAGWTEVSPIISMISSV